MYTTEQIEAILEEKKQILKKANNTNSIPEYNDIYLEAVDYAEKIAVHAEVGKFPERLFKKRAPNQTDEEFEYIKANHESITFPIWTRFIGVLNRIWSDQNWSIKWPDYSGDEEDSPQAYIESGIPLYKSLELYFKTIVSPFKEKDANAVLIVKLWEVPLVKNQDGSIYQDDDGNATIDDTVMIRPYPCIYGSVSVIDYVQDSFAMVESSEKSWVQYGNTKEKTGKIFEFVDDQNFYRIIQKGKKLEYSFDIFLVYNHGLGYLPAWKLKGIPIQKENRILYQPPLMSAVSPMNSMLLDNSYLVAQKAAHAFQHKWEIIDECEYTHPEYGLCNSGKITNDKGRVIDCPACKGTGAKQPGILGVKYFMAPNRSNEGSTNQHFPPIGWEAPKPEILQFLRDEISYNEERALSILNLKTSNSTVKGSDTALQSKIDREELFSFILGISNQDFELFENTCDAIIDMRYPDGIEYPEISCPKNFSIRDEQDITEEIAQAKETGLPDIVIRKLLIEYMNTRFNTEKNTSKIVDLVFAVDRLVTLSTTEIAQKKLSGSVSNWEDILHTSVYNFISEAVSKDSEFFDKTLEEQKRVVSEMAKTKDAELKPVTKTVEQILGGQS